MIVHIYICICTYTDTPDLSYTACKRQSNAFSCIIKIFTGAARITVPSIYETGDCKRLFFLINLVDLSIFTHIYIYLFGINHVLRVTN